MVEIVLDAGGGFRISAHYAAMRMVTCSPPPTRTSMSRGGWMHDQALAVEELALEREFIGVGIRSIRRWSGLA